MLIKSADDRTQRLQLLEELSETTGLDPAARKWAEKELLALRLGLQGERDAAHYLERAFGSSANVAVLHDLRLEADGAVAQIDHLLFDRLLTFYLLETKTFGGDLHINAHGEFHVEYRGRRRYGIPSPLEQSRRHEPVLRSTLDRLGIVGRAGIPPTFVHVVLVHPKAVIHRPTKDAVDTSAIIKADQFPEWHARHLDGISTIQGLGQLFNLRATDTLREWAERLTAEHLPAHPLDLPAFVVESLQAVAGAGANCAQCGKTLTPKVVSYCRDNAERFGGRLYCFAHQPKSRRK